jgi:hypothetical protein
MPSLQAFRGTLKIITAFTDVVYFLSPKYFFNILHGDLNSTRLLAVSIIVFPNLLWSLLFSKLSTHREER